MRLLSPAQEVALILPYRQIGGWPSSPTRIKKGVEIKQWEGNLARSW